MQLKKLLLLCLVLSGPILVQGQVIQIIATSDVHYAITRKHFRGNTGVDAAIVNAAMVKQMNTLPGMVLPADGGVAAGKKITAIDYLTITGDIANRMEPPYQSAAASWTQFTTDYLHSLTIKGHANRPTKLLLVPGNHDASNVVGTSKVMQPATDPTGMVQLYNLMMKPAQPKTNATYNYATDKIHYSVNTHGIHMVFVTIWPDSAERVWMEKDLQHVATTTPVIIFCHDPPIADPTHFTNPIPPYNMTLANKFSNLIAEHYKEGSMAGKGEEATTIEQRGLVAFLKKHPNIKAYFHGHTNFNEFYVYHGPDNNIALNTFRADSPMKGEASSKDETKLSFQLISIDPVKQQLTVRECLWNTQPKKPMAKVVFGDYKTVSLAVK